MKTIFVLANILAALTCTSAQAWQIETGDYDKWLNSLTPPAGVEKQVALFWKRNNLADPPLDYIADFGQTMKLKFTSEIKTFNTCANNTRIDFLDSVFSNSPAAAAPFENNFLRIESVNCLGRLNLDKVFNQFLDPEFNKRTIQGLKKITIDPNTNKVCHETSILAIGKSSYCFTQNIWKNEHKYVIHSFNEENAAGIEAPVYFRQVITVFEKLPSDEIIIYALAYGRGPNIPFKSLVKGVIKSQQKNLIDELIRSSQ